MPTFLIFLLEDDLGGCWLMLLEILVIVAGADFGCSDDINKKGIEHE